MRSLFDLASRWLASAQDSLQRLGYRPDLLLPGKYALWCKGAVNLSIRELAHTESRARRGGRAAGSGVAVLSSSDYLDGVFGRFSLLGPCASISICFRAWS